jgi:ADP-dependent NAD(P)H-hydrate dehydratase / NAD(P)H-hydrate epimerase
MLVLSAQEMQACDRTTTERFGVPSVELMRTASAAVVAFVREQFPRAASVTVLSGRGNNGGDGLMAARLLSTEGLKVTTILLGAPEALAGDAATAWQELSQGPQGIIHSVKTVEELHRLDAALDTDLIVDAVVGTGFRPPLRGMALAALEWIKASHAPIVAIDLPSGWPADANAPKIEDPVFPADAVITFTAPKPAHVFGELTRRWDQPIVVAPIGSPPEAIVSSLGLSWAGTAHDLVTAPRKADSNKGRFGHVLVVGGSVGKAGAPAMASLSALRAGAGLVTAAIPSPVLAQVAGFSPELMTQPLAASTNGQIAAKRLVAERFRALVAGKTVAAIGPGLGQSAGTVKFLASMLTETTIPAVVDADALNIIAAHKPLLSSIQKQGKAGRTFVFTPHPGEMARLAGTTVAEIQANRLAVARSFARTNGIILVLKGWRTLIAHPDGAVSVNTTGNPAMAKGGSGDMLTGLIAGLLAQYPGEPGRAVEAAVYIHGLAADLAVRGADEHTLLPTDSLHQFSRAFRFQSRGPNGYVWLQGLPEQP